jgi:8-oxo-dGTP pyrophosphatase MutT (NUDIX family)
MTRARAQRETSAGGVVIRKEDGAHLVLLIRDSYANWGFPKGHLEQGERAEDAALREVREETGLADLSLQGRIETIDWYFRFRGRLIHKVCHFFLMETTQVETAPQRAEGITACQWVAFPEASDAISYANARQVLRHAQEMIAGGPAPSPTPIPSIEPASDDQLGLGLHVSDDTPEDA